MANRLHFYEISSIKIDRTNKKHCILTLPTSHIEGVINSDITHEKKQLPNQFDYCLFFKETNYVPTLKYKSNLFDCKFGVIPRAKCQQALRYLNFHELKIPRTLTC